MNDWQYTFEAISKTDWWAQIQKDLKGKSVESISGEWWPGEPIQPFLHPEDKDWPTIRLPDELYSQPPRLIEYIDARQIAEDQVNSRILEALKFGAQHLQIHCQPDQYKNVDTWFKEVLTQIIRIDFLLENPRDKYLGDFVRHLPEGSWLRWKVKEGEKTIDSLTRLFKQTGSLHNQKFCLEYEAPSRGHFVDHITQTYNRLISDVQNWEAAGLGLQYFYDAVVWKMTCDTDYFKHLIQLRVLHLLWQNLYRRQMHQDVPASSYLESHVVAREDENPDHFLIRAASAALASVLAGTPALCVRADVSKSTPAFYERIGRDIHHLLYMESGFPSGTDPIAGAWIADCYTCRWTKQIWEHLDMKD